MWSATATGSRWTYCSRSPAFSGGGFNRSGQCLGRAMPLVSREDLDELRRSRRRTHLTVEQRRLALRLKSRVLSLREVGPPDGLLASGVALIVRAAPWRPVRCDGWAPGPGRLTLADREEITLACMRGSRSPRSPPGWEGGLHRHGKWPSMAAAAATGGGGPHQRACQQARQPKAPKLACPRLAAQVTAWLADCWSPCRSRPGCDARPSAT